MWQSNFFVTRCQGIFTPLKPFPQSRLPPTAGFLTQLVTTHNRHFGLVPSILRGTRVSTFPPHNTPSWITPDTIRGSYSTRHAAITNTRYTDWPSCVVFVRVLQKEPGWIKPRMLVWLLVILTVVLSQNDRAISTLPKSYTNHQSIGPWRLTHSTEKHYYV